MPQNDGVFRPVKVIAPKGTIFNPNFPRACFSRFCQTQRVVDNVNLALAEALPEKVTGGNSAGIHFCAYAGFDESLGEYWLYLEVNEGSYGGRFGKDAMDSVDNLMANTRNNPIEELDMRFPMRCDQYELRPEPAAPGQVARRHRDHPAQPLPRRRDVLVRGRPADRPAAAASSAAGTGSSRRAARTRTPPREEVLPAKVTGIPFAAGEFIEFREPNAAGYGDPLERPPEAVREDVLDDFTTIELARDAYGVVFADERTLEIDEAATEALRAELRAKPERRARSTEYFAGAPAAVGRAAGLGRGQPRARHRREARVAVKQYELVAERLRERVVDGELQPGERLPNEAVLADATSASAARPCARRCACSPRRT